MPADKEAPLHRKNRESQQRKSHLGLWLASSLLVIVAAAVAVIFVLKPFDTKPAKSVSASSVSISHSSSKVSSSTSAPIAPAWIKSAGQPNEVPTFMYHNVGENPSDSNTITPEALESDFQMLVTNGYTTLSADDAVRVLTTNEKPSNKMVWLTFDDSLTSFYTIVYPLLEKYHLHATSFVITGNVAKNVAGTFTLAQMQEMQKSGLVSFESHTVTHDDLSTMADSQQTTELQQSKAYLDKNLHQNTDVICYPAGSHNADTAGIATRLGYKAGLLDPGRTYVGDIATNAPAISTPSMFLLNRYRTSSNMDGSAMSEMLSEAEQYNTQNTTP